MDEEYLGYKTLTLSNEEIGNYYTTGVLPRYDPLLENEYLLVEDPDGNQLDVYCNRKGAVQKVPFKQISTRYLGKIKPRNTQQQMAVNLLYNDDITVKVLTGKFGTGKIFAPLCGNA